MPQYPLDARLVCIRLRVNDEKPARGMLIEIVLD